MSELAILGGSPSILRPLKAYRAHSSAEREAAKRVLDSGELSGFFGSPGPGFLGGPQVRSFEEEWAHHFSVRHAITVNSWTSGLEVCLQALALPRGADVIVPSWTMSASVTAIMHAGLNPIFCDIDSETFCVSVSEILQAETPNTVAVLVVDIFGRSADWSEIIKLAQTRGWRTISDSAQAPGLSLENGWAGTFADIGGFSLNYHKHIHTGEGGVIVTNNDELAERARLIRNHGEAVVSKESHASLREIIGHNFRMGEIEAAIGRVQLTRISDLVGSRRQVGRQMRDIIKDFSQVNVPDKSSDQRNAFYILPLTLIDKRIPRFVLASALRAEGVDIMDCYLNVHRMPLWAKTNHVSLKVSERLQDESFLGVQICKYEYDSHSMKLVSQAFDKVFTNIKELEKYASSVDN